MPSELPLMSLKGTELFPPTYKVLKCDARLESATFDNGSKSPELCHGLTAVLRRDWALQIRQVPCGLAPSSAKQRVSMQMWLSLHGTLKLHAKSRLDFRVLLTDLLYLMPLQPRVRCGLSGSGREGNAT